jgi:hypothetical protein
MSLYQFSLFSACLQRWIFHRLFLGVCSHEPLLFSLFSALRLLQLVLSPGCSWVSALMSLCHSLCSLLCTSHSCFFHRADLGVSAPHEPLSVLSVLCFALATALVLSLCSWCVCSHEHVVSSLCCLLCALPGSGISPGCSWVSALMSLYQFSLFLCLRLLQLAGSFSGLFGSNLLS